MQAAKMYNRKIVHYVADDAKKRVNAAFLVGAYSVRLLLVLLIRSTSVTCIHIVIFVICYSLEFFFRYLADEFFVKS